MTKRILIMGLPGAGKTTLAKEVCQKIWEEGRTCTWLNADEIRKQFNDWDFSYEGRIRQSRRMRYLADQSTFKFVIGDFVAPIPEMRTIFKPEYTIWVDTIKESIYEDTNTIFTPPENYDVRVTERDSEKWSNIIINLLNENIC